MVVALLALGNELPLGHDRVGHDVLAFVEELGRRVLDDAVLLDDVEETVLREARAVGNLLRQRRRELLHLVAHAAAGPVRHRVDLGLARADERHDALRTDGDVASIRHQRVQRNVEAGRQLDLGQVLLDLVGLRTRLRNRRPVDRTRLVHRTERFELGRMHGDWHNGETQQHRRRFQMKSHRLPPWTNGSSGDRNRRVQSGRHCECGDSDSSPSTAKLQPRAGAAPLARCRAIALT